MESVLRALVVYAFLLVVFRIAGKRTLAQSTNFELVLLLIISETIQEALVDQDHSVTNAFLLVLTMVATSLGLSLIKQRWPAVSKWLDGLPVAVIRGGKPDRELMRELRVDDDEVVSAARRQEGLRRIDEIEHAVVEENGEISVVPKRK
ncbi:MAG TPA: YetF domain-containing protein [Lysobacter sp.]|nr:YetF domain-containing protein [Lysobacter sp.]